MSAKRMFEFVEGSSSKFWEVWREGTEVRTRYGRIGSDGQTTVKSEADEAKAQKLYDKLVKEKTGKGYVEKTGGAAAPAAAPAPAAPAAAAPAPKKAAAKKPAKVEEEDDEEDEGDDEGDAGGASGWVRYEVDEKFWAIKLHGSSHTVKFGKIGTNGAEKTKDFDDAAAAKKDHDKLVKEKTGKGYERVESDDDDGEAAAPAPAAKPAAAPKKAAPAPAPKAAAKAAAKDDDEDDDGDEDDEDGAGGTPGERRFETDGKFWAISLDGASHTVRFGKVGTDGQEKTKTFDSEEEAKKDHDKLVKEKTGKGYEEV